MLRVTCSGIGVPGSLVGVGEATTAGDGVTGGESVGPVNVVQPVIKTRVKKKLMYRKIFMEGLGVCWQFGARAG